MIKKHYTGGERRALNVVWNAAGSYDFEPPFLAFYPTGRPDLYFDLVIGLACKYFDMGRLSAFYKGYEGSRKAQELDEYLWLGIENCVFEKELPHRPVLSRLRRERAEEFFRMIPTMSRQQMMFSSMPVLDQQEARWASVLDKRGPLLSPREQRIEAALRFPGALDTDALTNRMAEFLETYFHEKPGGSPHPQLMRAFAGRVMRHVKQQKDVLFLRTGSGTGDEKGSVTLGHFALGPRVHLPDADDEAYIESCFGPCILTQGEMRILENMLCKGSHAYCRLWIAGCGNARPDEDAALKAKRAAQEGASRAYLASNKRMLHGQVSQLTSRIDAIFESYLRFLPHASDSGRLEAGKAWRMRLLGDTHVFEKSGDEAEKHLSVTLLLDASMSRVNTQEVIASEAWVIAESFRAAGIPVQVLCFRSLRGFTVLEVLKSWNDKKADGVLRFYAGGWNRDALALRTVGELVRQRRAMDDNRQLLFVLTDGNPNDSTPMPPLKSDGSIDERVLGVSREYEGPGAVADTKAAVSELQKEGIRVGAVFHGATYHLESVRQIYGEDYIRIRRLDQLSGAVAGLLLRQMQKKDA